MKMTKYIIQSLTLLLAFSVLSCKDEDKRDVKPMQPAEISNVTADPSTPGRIVLHWNHEDVSTKDLLYVRVNYFDPYLNQDVSRLASQYADSIVIPNTYKVAGTYTFTLQPFSSSETGGNTHTIKADAVVVPKIIKAIPVSLSVDMLSTNAQEPSEGPIANLIDGNQETFFHTAWSVYVDAMHYFQVALKEPLDVIRYNFSTRHNGNGGGDVKRMKIEASNDGENWTEVAVHEFALNNYLKQTYHSEDIVMDKAYSYFRFTPLATRQADPLVNAFFNMSEFNLFKVTIVDPEEEAAEIINSYK